ncbi:MAG TPA: hypothetical protein VD906_12070 [Caulobacteraceae bacterium]|nr:hypothetical protein [Caulobacteraceae bacterium]
MPDPTRTQIRRGLALAAGVIALILAAALLFGRPEPEEPPPAKPGPEPLVVDTQPLPLPAPPLNRAELIAAAARAASAVATGKPPPTEDAALVGRAFRVAIPFGCAGPTDAESPGPSWSLDEERQTIKLTARPQLWTKEPWVAELAGQADIEAVEGFWLPRPWLLTADCPTTTLVGGAAGEELGLAVFFDADSSRLLRRGDRPYEHVMNVPAAGATPANGYRLVLAGRITGYEGGEPVRCRVVDPARRPVCLFAVSLDRVAFEDPAGGDTIAEWRLN